MPDSLPNAVAMQATQAPAETLLGIARGFRTAQALYVAAGLGIADLLADGARSVDELATASGTHAPSLYRLLRALASIGIFAEDDTGRFRLTPLAEPLCANAPCSVRNMIRFLGAPMLVESWTQLLYSVETGQPAFNHLHGMGLYAYLDQHPGAAAIFHAGMAATARHPAVLAAYDFAGASVVVDVGGGNGTLISAILHAYPALRGILFERPEIAAGARERMEREGLAGRCEVVGGSFFEAVPEGGDLYILSDVLHNWGDEEAIEILASCRRAMTESGRLLVIQQVLPPGNEPSLGKFADLNMLTVLGGRERTEDEFRRLLAGGDFALIRVIATSDSYSIVEAVPTGTTGR